MYNKHLNTCRTIDNLENIGEQQTTYRLQELDDNSRGVYIIQTVTGVEWASE